MVERAPANGDAARPALSVVILTWNSEARLPHILADVSRFADEILVGVDEASSDGTLEVAGAGADVVFRFEHTGTVEAARLIPLEFASADWILCLDDDERMDSRFPDLVPKLMSDGRYTHYWFPRKWIGQQRPLAYARALPWFPDWQPRLFRNDRTIVWHQPASHGRYHVVGPGAREDRTAIVHYERFAMTEEERREKVYRYRATGGRWMYEEFYWPMDHAPMVALDHVPPSMSPDAESTRGPARVIEGVQLALHEQLPPWKAELEVRMPAEAPAGGRTVAEVTAANSGGLAWTQPAMDWPRLFLSYHLKDAAGEVVEWDGERTPVGRAVRPGEEGSFLAFFNAPEELGDYVVEWDLVCEDQCWFAECGSATVEAPVKVVPAPEPPEEEEPPPAGEPEAAAGSPDLIRAEEPGRAQAT